MLSIHGWNMINTMFVTLQAVYDATIVSHGDNNYELEHMNKEFMKERALCQENFLLQKLLMQILNMMRMKFISSGTR